MADAFEAARGGHGPVAPEGGPAPRVPRGNGGRAAASRGGAREGRPASRLLRVLDPGHEEGAREAFPLRTPVLPAEALRGSAMRVLKDGVGRDGRTVWLEDGLVKMIDQRHLPFRLEIHEARDYEDVARAIEDMVVRGAPAIGATAAYVLAQAHIQGLSLEQAA